MKKKNSKTLVVDVGSASVGAGVVSYNSKEIPVLERVLRVPVGTGTQEVRHELEERMLVALQTLVTQCEGTYHAARLVLAAPWHHARIRTVESSWDYPATISRHTVSKMVELYKKEKPPDSGHRDVEAVAVQVRVHGYPSLLRAPVVGTNTSINLYESEADARLLDAILGTVSKYLNDTPIGVYTFPLIAGAALRMITREESFVFVDIGGEVTEVGIFYRDGFHFLASYPTGFWTLARLVGGGGADDASARLTLFCKNELSESEHTRMNTTFTASFTPWVTALEDVLKRAGAAIPIPRTVFLMSDAEPLLWIQKAIQEFGSLQLAATPISPTDVQRFLHVRDNATYDVFLALESLFFHTHEDGVVGEPVPRRMV